MANTAIIFNADGVLAMIVHPDSERELDTPTCNPSGCTHVRVRREAYDACQSVVEIEDLAVAEHERLNVDSKLRSAVGAARTERARLDAESSDAAARFALEREARIKARLTPDERAELEQGVERDGDIPVRLREKWAGLQRDEP